MVDWTGDWGFAEEVLRNVENAMPPCAFSFTPIWLHSYQLTVALDLIHYERSSLNPYEASKEDTSYGITIEEHEIAGNPDLASHYHPTGLVDSAAVQYSAFESDGRQPIVEDWTRLPNAVEMATSDSSAQQQVSLNTHDTGSFYQEFPSKHNSLDIPTDEEIQNQARWIIYDDDDPWNQTAADNAEWLARFKRDVGLTLTDEGPGLPPVGAPRPWRIADGGTGFHPPYLKPKDGKLIEFSEDVMVAVDDRTFNVSRETANQFTRALCAGQHRPPASVFCSRELENGLHLYLDECTRNFHYPTAENLRVKAQEILGITTTAADDPQLLEKFKASHLFR
ncbi:hypothetical protein ACHAO4_010467 [Trichoderma viride]